MLLNIIWMLLFVVPHQFYVSVTQIDHNAENKSLQITVKMFTDDLEKVLELESGERLFMGSEKEYTGTDSLLNGYIGKHLFINVNGKEQEVNWVGKEVELDATWCYLEIENVKKLKNIGVKSDLLIEEFEEQTNIVHVKSADESKSLMLSKKETNGTLEF